jgi:Mg2+/Co2+ transporter CorC
MPNTMRTVEKRAYPFLPIQPVLTCCSCREELQKLIELHVTNPEAQLESGLTKDDHRMLMGVMEYKKRRVKEVMTELDKVFMLESRRRLDFQTLFEVGGKKMRFSLFFAIGSLDPERNFYIFGGNLVT